ncbi:MAG TPA: hypothetical protein VIJ12_02535 [Candidatus Baltobacteraceae bacterium]
MKNIVALVAVIVFAAIMAHSGFAALAKAHSTVAHVAAVQQAQQADLDLLESGNYDAYEARH